MRANFIRLAKNKVIVLFLTAALLLLQMPLFSATSHAATGKPIPGKIEAENWDSMFGVQTEATTDVGGGLDVGWIDAGDWMNYTVNVASSGSYTVAFRVASPNSGEQVQLKDGVGNVLATANIPQTGGWQNWATVSVTANLSAGTQTLQVYAVTTGFNVNWISFSPTPALQNDKWYAAAPYVEVLSSPPDPGSYMSSTGIKGLTLAFILAPNGGGCTPEWDGSDAVATDTTAANYINSVRASGGDAVVSFGGAAGTKLGQTCASAADTANAEQQVINKYSLKAIDWDAEGTDETDAATVSKELGALQILQQNNPSLNISITLPSTPSGLDSNGLNVVQTAVNIGFTPNSWNIMPFDFGTTGTQMGTAAMNASDSLHTQLKGKYSWLSDTQVYNMSGLSLMNGRDDSGEFTYLSDFNNIRNYESSKGMARMTFWDGQRDYQCSPIDPGYTSSTCSGVAQNQWDFTKSIAKYLNSPQGNSSLKAMANGDYVSADNYGNNPLIANRTTVGTWETFKIYSNADGTVSFLSMINNKFVTADLNQSTKLIAEADVMNTWEKFKQIDNGDGTVSFQSVANNDYVSADLNFSGVLYANRTSIAGWEKFVISSAP